MVNIPADTVETGFRIERLDATRLHDLEVLHMAVYDRKPDPGFFARKFDTSFTGITFIGYIAYDLENIPVAYYGVFPLFMEQEENIFLAAQSGDTMTHPAYRNKGLFVLLANHTYELCRQYKIKLVYGFPNQNSWHGLVNKLGWKMDGRLLRYTIGVQPVIMMKILKRWPRLYEYYRRRILSKYLLPDNGLKHSAASEGYGGVHRSEAYLRYKKYGNSFVLNISDAKLWVRTREDMTIGDMHCGHDNFEDVMRRLKAIASRLGLNEIKFQLSPGTRLNALFESKFGPVESFAICFKVLDESIQTHGIKFTFADIDIF